MVWLSNRCLSLYCCSPVLKYCLASFWAIGENSSQINYRDYVGISCTLKDGKKRWEKNCTFPDGICNLSCYVTSCEIGQDNMTKLCGRNCSQTYSPLVYQCIEREHKENIRSQTCNATKFNLICGEEDFVTKQTCHCEGNQCHLKCTKIQCTQTCRERKTGGYLINLTSHQGSLYKRVSGNGVMAFTANFFYD